MKYRNKKDHDSVVEVISFNYDGKGSALYHYIGSRSIEEISLSDLQDKLLGANGGEAKYEIDDSD